MNKLDLTRVVVLPSKYDKAGELGSLEACKKNGGVGKGMI